MDELPIGGRSVWGSADVVGGRRVCGYGRERDYEIAELHVGLEPAARADAEEPLDAQLRELLDHDRRRGAAHTRRLHRNRLALERSGVAEHPSLPVPLLGVLEERLGDILRAQRVSREETGLGVLLWVRAHMNRHGRGA